MRLDFICPGEGKCGTTTLHNILQQHPNICLPLVKEPQWLNNYELCNSRDMQWYEKHYFGISEECPQKDDILYGEINPSFGVVSIKRLYNIFGKMKIIIALRNPVERLWSHFNHAMNNANVMLSDTKSEKAYRDAESKKDAFSLFCGLNFKDINGKVRYIGGFNNILSQHRYKFNCEMYSRFFGIENIKIVLLEELEKSPKTICEDLFKFLGIRGGVYIKCSIRANIGNYNQISNDEHNYLVKLEKKRMEAMINGEKLEVKEIRAGRILQSVGKTKKESISEECIQLLQKYFKEDKEYIEEYIQKDLSDIWF